MASTCLSRVDSQPKGQRTCCGGEVWICGSDSPESSGGRGKNVGITLCKRMARTRCLRILNFLAKASMDQRRGSLARSKYMRFLEWSDSRPSRWVSRWVPPAAEYLNHMISLLRWCQIMSRDTSPKGADVVSSATPVLGSPINCCTLRGTFVSATSAAEELLLSKALERAEPSGGWCWLLLRPGLLWVPSRRRCRPAEA